MKKSSPAGVVSKDLVAEILAAIRDPLAPVMLFGSVARGDYSSHSDIDVLELSARRTRSYRNGRVSVSRYDESTLCKMARSGSLFVLHLVTEGKILRDPTGRLGKCLAAYQAPKDYESYRESLRETANLLDVSPVEYAAHWQAYNHIVIFVLRSALYARFAEIGEPLFSMASVTQRIGRPEISASVQLTSGGQPDNERFVAARALVEELLRTKCRNVFGTAEALVTNLGLENPLVLGFGLRLFGALPVEQTYDLLAISPFES